MSSSLRTIPTYCGVYNTCETFSTKGISISFKTRPSFFDIKWNIFLLSNNASRPLIQRPLVKSHPIIVSESKEYIGWYIIGEPLSSLYRKLLLKLPSRSYMYILLVARQLTYNSSFSSSKNICEVYTYSPSADPLWLNFFMTLPSLPKTKISPSLKFEFFTITILR